MTLPHEAVIRLTAARSEVLFTGSTLATAQAAARKILEDDGKPAETFEVRSPDVPYIRKGDKVKVATRVYEGFAHVLSVQHNATNRAMTMTIEPLAEAGDEKADDQSAGSEPQER